MNQWLPAKVCPSPSSPATQSSVLRLTPPARFSTAPQKSAQILCSHKSLRWCAALKLAVHQFKKRSIRSQESSYQQYSSLPSSRSPFGSLSSVHPSKPPYCTPLQCSSSPVRAHSASPHRPPSSSARVAAPAWEFLSKMAKYSKPLATSRPSCSTKLAH